ncbi:hypothetical protein FCV25MIE_14308, partial [Fagus crenata]
EATGLREEAVTGAVEEEGTGAVEEGATGTELSTVTEVGTSGGMGRLVELRTGAGGGPKIEGKEQE